MTAPLLPRIALTPGEPAGIGPDLTLVLAQEPRPAALVAYADPGLLRRRAARLGLRVEIVEVDGAAAPERHVPGRLQCVPVDIGALESPGSPDTANAAYVLETLRRAATDCMAGRRDALVTGPVQKSIINDAGVPFSGHTEFLAELSGAAQPVMLLAGPAMRVALVTTHLPLAQVSAAITQPLLERVLGVVAHDLHRWFGIAAPRLLVCGLNPHAGESGHLGREELDVIAPVIARLRRRGLDLRGPVPADTAFLPAALREVDAVVAMYHDQGLPVVKHAGFEAAVNVTLGLPLLRTSVDHGTALDLAGTGRADAGSLRAALELAVTLAGRGRRP